MLIKENILRFSAIIPCLEVIIEMRCFGKFSYALICLKLRIYSHGSHKRASNIAYKKPLKIDSSVPEFIKRQKIR